jgi:hypothetical protein
MPQNKRNKQRARVEAKKKQQKKPLIDPRYKNLFWTVVVIIILLIFFIINNTRYVPDHGLYPPGFDPAKHKNVSTSLNKELYGLHDRTKPDSNSTKD